MPRTILVFGDRNFRITIPDDAKITFGPWSPPKMAQPAGGRYVQQTAQWDAGDKRGTLRIYKTEKNILALFSGVTSFRDEALEYKEMNNLDEIANAMVGRTLSEGGDEGGDLVGDVLIIDEPF